MRNSVRVKITGQEWFVSIITVSCFLIDKSCSVGACFVPTNCFCIHKKNFFFLKRIRSLLSLVSLMGSSSCHLKELFFFLPPSRLACLLGIYIYILISVNHVSFVTMSMLMSICNTHTVELCWIISKISENLQTKYTVFHQLSLKFLHLFNKICDQIQMSPSSSITDSLTPW